MKGVNRTKTTKKIMKYLKKINKVYLNYLDNISEGIDEDLKDAYLSMTSFRDSVTFNNSPKLPDKYYISTWEGVNAKR